MKVEEYATHFKVCPHAEDLPELTRFVLAQCPVARSDEDGGFVVANRYQDVFRVLQDWQDFSSGVAIPSWPEDARPPKMPPIDFNPPLQRQYRSILNPYLTPTAVTQHEPAIRGIVTDLIEEFVPDGKCDIVSQFARPFPPYIAFRCLFGLEDQAQVEKMRQWVHTIQYDRLSEHASAAHLGFAEWVFGFIAQRRAGERREDIIDGLLYGVVEEDRPLGDEEIAGAIFILTLGGFATTADATGSFVVRLAENPSLQERLTSEPELLPRALEEHLRLEPPVTALARLSTRDNELSGHAIEAGERVMMNFLAANHDPSEFDRPDEFDLNRQRNRHLAFGGGPHRCVGSNLARVALRIAISELLTRVKDIRIAEGEKVQRIVGPSAWGGLDSVPISFKVR